VPISRTAISARLADVRAVMMRAAHQVEARDSTMTTVMVFHEVDDVDHWVRSPKREEFFGPLGMTARTFVDPDKTNRVGLIVEVPPLMLCKRRWDPRGRPRP